MSGVTVRRQGGAMVFFEMADRSAALLAVHDEQDRTLTLMKNVSKLPDDAAGKLLAYAADYALRRNLTVYQG